MDTPVTLFLFRRPETTARVFEAIRGARPSRLFLIADGPRPDHPEEGELCEKARAVVDLVDWECEVSHHYASRNLGCGDRITSGLDWVFEQVEEAIILEDDCVPHASFFPYCEALLRRFRSDARVMHINGNNFGSDHRHIHPYSYAFCRFPQAWGWATWRRAWEYFDSSIERWPTFREEGWMASLPLPGRLLDRQEKRWDQVHGGRGEIWDFQWHFCVMSQHGLAVSPARNLVSNIGFGVDATHTLETHSPKASLATHAMKFPLVHPPFVTSHPQVDHHYATAMLGSRKITELVRKVWFGISKRGE